MNKTFKKLTLLLVAFVIVVMTMQESAMAYSKSMPFEVGTYTGDNKSLGTVAVGIAPIQGEIEFEHTADKICGKRRKMTSLFVTIRTGMISNGITMHDEYTCYLYQVSSKKAVGVDDYGSRIDVVRKSKKKIKVRIGGKGNSWATCKYQSDTPFQFAN